MNEKERVYRTMSITGAGNIAAGIVVVTLGVTVGVLSIISGAKLLKTRKNILI